MYLHAGIQRWSNRALPSWVGELVGNDAVGAKVGLRVGLAEGAVEGDSVGAAKGASGVGAKVEWQCLFRFGHLQSMRPVLGTFMVKPRSRRGDLASTATFEE